MSQSGSLSGRIENYPMITTVFLGGGNITACIIAGLHRANYSARIVVHDRNTVKLRKLKRQFGVSTEPDLAEAVAQADLLIVAVRPSDVSDLLRNLRALADEASLKKKRSGSRKPTPVLACSLAAGIPLDRLQAASPTYFRWARAMPSPACQSGYGLTALCFASRLSRSERLRVKRLFEVLGTVLEIHERQFDAFTAAYSCTHGYHAVAVLAGAAQKAGLDRKTAELVAAHALADGILAWRNAEKPLDELLSEATTPGGIASSVIDTMNGQGYASIVERGLRAGIARARQNAKAMPTKLARK